MANVAVTCIKNGRSDSFGRPLVSGTYYPSVEIETAKALWNSGYVSVADASVFDQDPLAGTSPLDDFNIARALSLSRQPAQTSANIAAELAQSGVLGALAVERFRGPGDTDDQVVNKALRYIEADAAGNSALIFEAHRVYTLYGAMQLNYINNLDINGNGAIILRGGAAITATTLGVAASSASTSLVVSNIPSAWGVGDNIAVTFGTNDADASSVMRITGIDAATKTVTLQNALGATVGGATTYPIGTTVFKVFSLISGVPSSTDSTTLLDAGSNKRIRIHGFEFQGNSAQQLSSSWRFNNMILLHTEGGAIYDNKFTDTSSECIVGHGFDVGGGGRNTFVDLRGSAVHLSCNDQTASINQGATIQGNLFRRTNLAGTTANGHCEGAITFSWGPGELIVDGNQFDGGSESVLGAFRTSAEANGSRNLVFSNNICKGYNKVFYSVLAGTRGVIVSDNVLHDCADNSALISTLSQVDNQIKGNAVSGTTILPQTNSERSGTFVPIIQGSVAAGVGTYTAQVGQYTISGGWMHFVIYVKTTAHTGTGNTLVTGFPSIARAGVTYMPVTMFQVSGPIVGAGKQRIAVKDQGNLFLTLREWDPSTGVTTNSNAIQAANEFYISGSFPVNP